MFKDKNNIKKEQKQIIGIIPCVDMEGFIALLLATLADKTEYHYLLDENINTVCLSADYKRIIEDIMYEENNKTIEFASIIDICEYYESQNAWEQKLGTALKKVLNTLNKEFRYVFEFDELEIDFTKEEISAIKSMYDDKTLIIMKKFADLISNYSYTRSFKINSKENKRNANRMKNEINKKYIKILKKQNKK